MLYLDVVLFFCVRFFFFLHLFIFHHTTSPRGKFGMLNFRNIHRMYVSSQVAQSNTTRLMRSTARLVKGLVNALLKLPALRGGASSVHLAPILYQQTRPKERNPVVYLKFNFEQF